MTMLAVLGLMALRVAHRGSLDLGQLVNDLSSPFSRTDDPSRAATGPTATTQPAVPKPVDERQDERDEERYKASSTAEGIEALRRSISGGNSGLAPGEVAFLEAMLLRELQALDKNATLRHQEHEQESRRLFDETRLLRDEMAAIGHFVQEVSDGVQQFITTARHAAQIADSDDPLQLLQLQRQLQQQQQHQQDQGPPRGGGGGGHQQQQLPPDPSDRRLGTRVTTTEAERLEMEREPDDEGDGDGDGERRVYEDDPIGEDTAVASGPRETEKICFDLDVCPSPMCRCPPCKQSVIRVEGNTPPSCAPDRDGRCPIPKLTRLPQPTGVFFLVVGPEGSGNRYMVSMLLSMGCEGTSGHRQHWDIGVRFASINIKKLSHETPRCAVMHRSMPHNGLWINIRSLAFSLAANNYEPRIVYMSRSTPSVARSQQKERLAKNEEHAIERISRARRTIYEHIATTDAWFLEVQYEQLGDLRYVAYVYHTLGYRYSPEADSGAPHEGIPPGHPPFRNENAKYFPPTTSRTLP